MHEQEIDGAEYLKNHGIDLKQITHRYVTILKLMHKMIEKLNLWEIEFWNLLKHCIKTTRNWS